MATPKRLEIEGHLLMRGGDGWLSGGWYREARWKAPGGIRTDDVFVRKFGNGGGGGRGWTNSIDWRGINPR